MIFAVACPTSGGLPRQSAIDFQNGKFFFTLKKNGGREILKKMEK